MIRVAGIDITCNTASASVAVSVDVQTESWKLRDAVLNARTASGHRPIETETLTGTRVITQSRLGAYNPVPMNNDAVLADLSRLYAVTTVTLQASACDASLAASFRSLAAADAAWYVSRRLQRQLLDSDLTTYPKKLELEAALLASESFGGFELQVPGLATLTNCRFAETGGLDASYWTNGPYADLKMTVIHRRRI